MPATMLSRLAALPAVVSLVTAALVGVALVPASSATPATARAEAAATSQSVTPNSGTMLGGTATTLSVPELAAHISATASGEYSAFIGTDGLLYTPWGATWPTPAGVTFEKVSGARYGSNVFVSAISTTHEAYFGNADAGTFTKLPLPAGVTAVDTWDMVAVLGSNGRLYTAWSGAAWPDPDQSNGARTWTMASGLYGSDRWLSAIDSAGQAYTAVWGTGSPSLSKQTGIPATATLTADYSVVIAGGLLYMPWGTKWVTPAGVTFTTASGANTGSRAWVSAIDTTGQAYSGEAGQNGDKVLPIATTQTMVSTTDFTALLGTDKRLYLPWGGQWPGSGSIEFSSVTGWNPNGEVWVAAIAVDGTAYVGRYTDSSVSPLVRQGGPYTVTSVTFGGTAATAVVQSADKMSITATTPAHAPGTVDVVVKTKKSDNATGPTFTITGGYTYTVPAPTVAPASSPVNGAHKLTGTGVPGATLKVLNASGTELDSVTVAANGTWTASVVAGAALPLSVFQRVSSTDSSAVSVTYLPVPTVTAEITADPSELTNTGDHTTLTVTVTNSGNVAVTPTWSLSAPSAVGVVPSLTSCSLPSVLAPNDHASCVVTYELLQGDVNHRSLAFTAEATGTTSDAVTVSNSATVTVTTKVVPGLPVTVGTVDAVSAPGAVPFSFTVKNTGNMPVSQLAASVGSGFAGSGTVSALTCTAQDLEPGASTSCSGSYALVQADLDRVPAGVSIPVTVAARQLDLTTTTTNATVTIPVTQSPAATVAVTASGTPTRAGEKVTFTARITNTGNVSVSTPTVTTISVGSGTAPTWSCSATAVSPLGYRDCSVDYQLTQADVDAGSVTMTVSASVTGPSGTVSAGEASAPFSIPTTATLGVSIVTSPGQASALVAGDEIAVTATVTNTGTVTLSTISASVTSVSPAVALTCPATALSPGSSLVCSGRVTVTQDHVDAGSAGVTVMPAAAHPAGAIGTAATVVVPIVRSSKVSAVVSASPAAVDHVGQTVAWSVVITNAGSTRVSNGRVSVESFTGHGTALTWTCSPSGAVLPNHTITCTATSMVVQDDLDAGSIALTAIGRADSPEGVVSSAPRTTSVDVDAHPGIAVALDTPSPVSAVGVSVPIRAVLTNTGNVVLSAPAVTSTDGPTLAFSCAASTIPAGGSVECTAAHVVDQSDADAGSVSFTVTGRATGPNQQMVTTPSGSTATLTIAVAPGLSVAISGAGEASKRNDTVTFTAIVRNTGAVTLHDIAVASTGRPGSALLPAWTCPGGDLLPNASRTCTVLVPVSQTEVDGGAIVLEATASAQSPRSVTVTAGPRSATVPIAGTVSVAATATVHPAVATTVGTTVEFAAIVTNTGTVTLTNPTTPVTLITGSGTVTFSCAPGDLAPGASVTCRAPHAVTQEDLDLGGLNVQVTPGATGKDPLGTTVTGEVAFAHLDVSTVATLAIASEVSPDRVDASGTTVRYSVDATNTGTVTLHGITIVQDSFDGWGAAPVFDCPSGSVAPGAQVTCTASYTTVQDDLDITPDTGYALDLHATGLTPTSATVMSPGQRLEVEAVGQASLTIAGSATGSPSAVGDDVVLEVTITNTGTVTITGVRADALAASTAHGPVPPLVCAARSLAPGAATTCTTVYVATQGDLDGGEATIVIGARGDSPSAAVSAEDPAHLPFATSGTVAVTPVLVVTPNTAAAVGETVRYTLTLLNSGTLTLSSAEAQPVGFTGSGTAPVFTCATGVSAPGTSRHCTAEYRLTQADVDGSALVSVGASGTASSLSLGSASFAAPTVSVAIEAVSAFEVDLTATPSTMSAAGDRVDYTARVTNTGTRTLTGLSVLTDTESTVSTSGLAALLASQVPFTGTGETPEFTCPAEPLAPHDEVVCTASYLVTASDVAAGALVLSVSATAQGGAVTAHASSSTTVHATPVIPPTAPRGLAHTGSTLPVAGLVAAGVLVILGTAAIVIVILRRRRRDERGEVEADADGGAPE